MENLTVTCQIDYEINVDSALVGIIKDDTIRVQRLLSEIDVKNKKQPGFTLKKLDEHVTQECTFKVTYFPHLVHVQSSHHELLYMRTLRVVQDLFQVQHRFEHKVYR